MANSPAQVKVYFAQLRPESIINLDQPCHYEEFHDQAGYIYNSNKTFERINQLYLDYMEEYTEHWSRLLTHITDWGIRYPIVVNTGVPKIRPLSSVPIDVRATNSKFWMTCEQQGGGRIMAAKKLGITVPAIINDYVGLFEGQTPITMRELARLCQDLDQIYVSHDFGVRINDYPRIHLQDISCAEYAHCKFLAIKNVYNEYQSWDTTHQLKERINTLQRIEYETNN